MPSFFLNFGFIYLFIYLFIYFWLRWVFVSVRGLSLVAASGGHSSSRCAGLSLSRPLLLRSTGSRSAGSVVVAHGRSCSAACGILPDQGSNPCPLHWQADSQPLHHQRRPMPSLTTSVLWTFFFFLELRNRIKRPLVLVLVETLPFLPFSEVNFCCIQMTQSFLPVNEFFRTLE